MGTIQYRIFPIPNGHPLRWIMIWSFAIHAVYSYQSSGRNVTLDVNGPQFTYFPFICNARSPSSFTTINSTHEAGPCNGGWAVEYLDGHKLMTTNGTDPMNLAIVPQILFRVQASAVFITTSRLSNATAALSAVDASATFNSSLGSAPNSIAIFNLRQNEVTNITLSFVPDDNANDVLRPSSRLDLSSVVILISDRVSPIALPTMTVPPSATLPTALPESTTSGEISLPLISPSATGSSGRNKLVADAVGITIGLGFGLTILTLVAYASWRRWRGRKHLVFSR
ncbi:hypothetical protein AX17_002797 [Amanita inopinata Kibby_2008]|nr:hypothetical protein AX17_002797 [Amanita inopinata Kibby_2008]